MRLIILSSIILSGCTTLQGHTSMSALSEQTRAEIMTDIAEHYGVEPIPAPIVSVSSERMNHPTAMCEAKKHQIIGTWVVCRKEPPAHVYYHEAVHVYQNHYSLPMPLGTGCKRPREFDAWLLTSRWCKRTGGCPSGVVNPDLRKAAECPA